MFCSLSLHTDACLHETPSTLHWLRCVMTGGDRDSFPLVPAPSELADKAAATSDSSEVGAKARPSISY